jgi:hypothetical protein
LHIAAGACFTASLTTLLALGGFPTAGKTDLIQRVHFCFTARLFLVRGFWKLNNGVDAATFAFASEDALGFTGRGGVSGERHYASDGGVAIDACDGGVVVVSVACCRRGGGRPFWVREGATGHFAGLIALELVVLEAAGVVGAFRTSCAPGFPAEERGEFVLGFGLGGAGCGGRTGLPLAEAEGKEVGCDEDCEYGENYYGDL